MALSISETALLIAEALKERDVHAMRKVNDRCIDETAVKFSQHTYLFALISYVLSKVMSKPRFYTQSRAKESLARVALLLRSCESCAKKADYAGLLSSQNRILLAIEKMDDADRRFVKGIIAKGKLKIASTLYAQGISLGLSSEMTGTDKRELLLYAGQTMMFDRLHEKKTIGQRMKDLREIFS
ncbi:Uncharacterised protein [uncultured archaeon]|nr:Uncharacterised protein [uncultured archaeon]